MSTTTAGTATKEQHYTGILHSALVSGQWKEEPGLGWKEMFRKVRKHRATPANTETDEELVYTLSLLLLSTSSTSCELEENRVNEIPATHSDASPTVKAYYLYALGKPEECLSTLESTQKNKESQSEWEETQHIRDICLLGMSHEKLGKRKEALETYSTALPFCQGKKKPFKEVEESYRWMELILYRAVLLATESQAESQQWIEAYSFLSSFWPPTFRASHRCTICRHLLSLPSPSKAIVDEYKALLSVRYHFPKADESNVEVEEFLDRCMTVWLDGKRKGDWIVDVLWWGTKLTFNSPLIYRHLIHAYIYLREVDLAKRTLTVYVQIVSRAEKEEEAEDVWVQTVCKGVKLYCETKETKEAEELLVKLRERSKTFSDDLKGLLELAEGICATATGNNEGAHKHFVRSTELSHTPEAFYYLAKSCARARTLDDGLTAIGEAIQSDAPHVKYWHLLGLLLAAKESWEEALATLETGADIEGEWEERVQLRMTQVVIYEMRDGGDAAVEVIRELFEWIGETKPGIISANSIPTQTAPSMLAPSAPAPAATEEKKRHKLTHLVKRSVHGHGHDQSTSSIRTSGTFSIESGASTISPTPAPPSTNYSSTEPSKKTISGHQRLLSEVWVMSSATYRRLGKLEQAKEAIQEAEMCDEANPAVYVQLALYHEARGRKAAAIEAVQKALILEPYDVSATVHLSRFYLTFPNDEIPEGHVDIAVSLLQHLTQHRGCEVSEVWYFLSVGYRLQGRKTLEKESLKKALELVNGRSIRDLDVALGV